MKLTSGAAMFRTHAELLVETIVAYAGGKLVEMSTSSRILGPHKSSGFVASRASESDGALTVKLCTVL